MLKEQKSRLDSFDVWYTDHLKQHKLPPYTGGDMFNGQDPEEVDISQIFTKDEIRRLEKRGLDSSRFPGVEIAQSDLQIFALVARCYIALVGDEKYPSDAVASRLRTYIQFADNTGVTNLGYGADDWFNDVVQRICAAEQNN